MRWVDNSPTCALIGKCKRHFRVIRQKYLLFAENGENNSCIIFSVVAVVVVAILASKASNLPQEGLVLSPELSIHDTINDWVDSATQIDQESVRQVNLSWYRQFSAHGVQDIHNGDRKPAAREAKQNYY